MRRSTKRHLEDIESRLQVRVEAFRRSVLGDFREVLVSLENEERKEITVPVVQQVEAPPERISAQWGICKVCGTNTVGLYCSKKCEEAFKNYKR